MDRSGTIPTPQGFDPVKADWLPVQIYESDAYRSRMGKAGDAADGWQVYLLSGRYCCMTFCPSQHVQKHLQMEVHAVIHDAKLFDQ